MIKRTITMDTKPTDVLAEALSKITNPTMLDRPAFLLNVPFSLSTGQANNKWMQDMSERERTVDTKRALVQFAELYRYMVSEALYTCCPRRATARARTWSIPRTWAWS